MFGRRKRKYGNPILGSLVIDWMKLDVMAIRLEKGTIILDCHTDSPKATVDLNGQFYLYGSDNALISEGQFHPGQGPMPYEFDPDRGLVFTQPFSVSSPGL